MLTRGVLFYYENAPAYTSVIAMAIIYDYRDELVPDPPYSPLAPSEFYQFSKNKKSTGWSPFCHFDNDVIDAGRRFLEVFCS